MFIGGQFVGPKNPTPEKVQPFECGNDTDGRRRHVKLSVKFYLTAILFVVFDIEVVFMYPWAVQFKTLGWTGFLDACSASSPRSSSRSSTAGRKGALEWES